MPAADRAAPRACGRGTRPSGWNLPPMSAAASQRPAPRRRFSLTWRRPTAATTPTRPRGRRRFAYDEAAEPTRQPALATLLPVGLGGFCGLSTSLIVIFLMTTGIGIWEIATGRPLAGDVVTGRFGPSIAAAKRCVRIDSLDSLGGWQAQACLACAAITALSIQGIRRHRQDGRRGGHRAWGSLAFLFVLTSCAAEAPLAPLFSALASDATGVTAGPGGMAWWTLFAGLAYVGCGLWAVLPLAERALPGGWLAAGLSAWAAAAACGWIGTESPRAQAVANVAWMAAANLSAIAMFAAARSVIREVLGLSQGEPRRRVEPANRGERAGGAPGAPVASVPTTVDDDERRSSDWADESPAAAVEETVFIDGDEEDAELSGGRRLSKAERRRLKKLARLGRAA